MTNLDKYWATVSSQSSKAMISNAKIASPHRLDIARTPDAVGSSTRFVHW